MRVLALVTDAFGGHGGIAQYNRDFLTALSISGFITAVTALPRFGTPSAPLPVGITQLPSSSNRVAWSAQAVRFSLQSPPDVIFCGHLNAAPLAAAIGKVIARPVWTQVHGIEAWSERSRLMRRAIEASSLVTAVSRYTRHRLLSWCDLPPARVRVLPNTFPPVHRKRAKRDDLVSRHKLAGRKVILTVGRMAAAEAYKGHDRVIRCLPRLKSIEPEVVYLVVGSGDDRPRLESIAREMGIADIVVFTGQAATHELPDYYALADVFAMPSTGEGFGIVFLEAAALGLPVIGGNRDGSVDALADGVIGKPVDPGDCDALVAALAKALKGIQRGSPDSVHRFAFESFARHVDDLARSLVR
jgi:phosphatidyl-myo-inositol dimannoside synthase